MSTVNPPYGGQPKRSVVQAHAVPCDFVVVNKNRQSTGEVVRISADLFYDPLDNPLAVRVVLNAAEPTEWFLGRDFFLKALKNQKIDWITHDVHMSTIGQWLFIDLNSPFGFARIRFPVGALNAFFVRTLSSVPLGEEVDDNEMDLELIRILEEGL